MIRMRFLWLARTDPFGLWGNAAVSIRRTLEELLALFVPRLGAYDYIHVSAELVGLCLFGIYVGVFAAMLLTAYDKSLHADLFGTLMDLGADSPETAVTLGELGFARNRRIRRELSEGIGVARYLRLAKQPDRCDAETADAAQNQMQEDLSEQNVQAIDETSALEAPAAQEIAEAKAGQTAAVTGVAEARYYLPKEARIAAEVRYEPSKRRIGGVVLAVALLTAAYAAMLLLTPTLLGLIDALLGMLA